MTFTARWCEKPATVGPYMAMSGQFTHHHPVMRHRNLSLLLALILPLTALCQPAKLARIVELSTELVSAKNERGMHALLDSLQHAPDIEERILRDLLLARWYRHTDRQLDAHHLLDTIRIDTTTQHPYLSWLRHYQHAKTLKSMLLLTLARTAAVQAEHFAERCGMADEVFEMKLLACEIDLDDGLYGEAAAELGTLYEQAKAQGNIGNICRTLIALGNVHYYQQNDSAATRFFMQAMRAAQLSRDNGLILSSVLNLGAAMSFTEGPQAAIALYRSVLDTAGNRIGNIYRGDLLANLASMYSDMNDHRRAVIEIDQSLAAYGAALDTTSMAQAHLFKATALWGLGDRAGALDQVNLCLQRSKEKDLNAHATRKAAQYLHSMGRDAEAYDMLMTHAQLNDSLAREKFSASTASAQVQFETAEKERRIVAQQQALALAAAEDRRKNLQRIALSVAILAVSIIAVLLARSLRNRRKMAAQEHTLHLQQVDELMHKHEIGAINAMLEGQEKERGRVAQDLHDRLGAMLSTIKMQLGALEEKVDLVRDDQRIQYGKVTNLLDEAVGEVRRISHDMVAITLSRFGLAKALEGLCESVRVHGRLGVELDLFGLEQRMAPALEITAYRIIQELISNALKHANARELSVSVTHVPGHLSVMVSDDGRGFDADAVPQGIGLDNVRNRAAAIGAVVRIDSTPGHGTTVTVEGPVME